MAEISRSGTVLEIGPGRGMLTRELLARAKKVIAIEADENLVVQLRTVFEREINDGRLELRLGDIRELELSKMPKGYEIVANIPYYLTGELFKKFLASGYQPSRLTFLVQKEVAERIARPKAGKESIISLSVKAFGEPKYEFTVPKGAFNPPPKVDSAVISIRQISRRRLFSRADEEQFFRLLHAGFAHKRKYVRSNLKAAGVSEARLAPIPEKARAEDLPLAAWLALSKPDKQ